MPRRGLTDPHRPFHHSLPSSSFLYLSRSWQVIRVTWKCIDAGGTTRSGCSFTWFVLSFRQIIDQPTSHPDVYMLAHVNISLIRFDVFRDTPRSARFFREWASYSRWSDRQQISLKLPGWVSPMTTQRVASQVSFSLSPSLSPLFVADSNGSRSNGSAYTSEFAALRTDLFFLYVLRHNLTSCSRLFLLNRFDVSALMALGSREA